jgi:hypothetical protein
VGGGYFNHKEKAVFLEFPSNSQKKLGDIFWEYRQVEASDELGLTQE